MDSDEILDTSAGESDLSVESSCFEDTVSNIDELLDDLANRYPSDSEELKNEVQSLKRKVLETKDFVCEICQKEFCQKRSYLRHRQSHRSSLTCCLCDKTFSRADNLKRHQRNAHFMNYRQFSPSYTCTHCGIDCQDYSSLFNHVSSMHPFGSSQSGSGITKHEISSESALNQAATDYNIYPTTSDKYDLLEFYSNIRQEIVEHLYRQCETLYQIKWSLSLQVELMRETLDGVRDMVEPYFKSVNYTLLSTDPLNDDDYLNEAFRKQFKSFDEYLAHGSGWTLRKIIKMTVHTVQYKAIRGSSYFELPKSIRRSKAVVNIQNTDDKCFLWAILAGLHPVRHNPQRVTHYEKYEHTLNTSGISFPVCVQQVNKFERQNMISITVIGFENDTFFPLYMTKLKGADVEIELLYVKRGKQSHYCLIKSLNRLLARTTPSGRCYKFCRYCLQPSSSQLVLDKHLQYCSTYEAQRTEYPIEGVDDVLEFTDFAKQMRVPFIIYADMEAFCQDICGHRDISDPGITKMKEFKASGFGYQVVCIDDKYTKSPVIYRGPDVTKTFLKCLLREEKNIKEILSNIQPLQMNRDDKEAFAKATSCHICGNNFNVKTGKVRDHCHLSGKFRGAACSNCNLNFKYPSFIPIIFHNLRGFDAHLICESLGLFKKENISCISQNMVKYISFSLGNLRFLDSYQFLNASLADLVNDLRKEDKVENFRLFNKEYPLTQQQELLMRKGVYPYSWAQSNKQFLERQLPSQEMFYNDISKSHICKEDYIHAQTVWNVFDISNFGEYHDLYLKADVLQLACVFERFRDISLQDYHLDPAHYYTTPGLTWSAALKMTNCKLSLITDPDVYLFWESGLRGGISQISNRYAKANNSYIPNAYDANQKSTFVSYLDCGNLYGKSMSNFLPTGNFRFLEEEEMSQLDITEIPDDSSKGYLIECDLHYPKELHDTHSDYPLAPETMTIPNEWLSKQSHEHWQTLNPFDPDMRRRVKTPKLVCSLFDKHNYILHYRNLKLYLQLGMQIKQMHRVLEFDQSPWLKSYIEFNSEKRKLAQSDFKKSFYKLMNNAVFGKTMENVRNRVDIKLIHRRKSFLKHIAKPSFQHYQIFNEDLVGVQMRRVTLKLNKPLYIGMAILDLSKCIMYDFHYNHMMKKYPNGRLKLLMTDTDSLLYQIETQDVYKDMLEDKHLYDLSNFPKHHFLYDDTNKRRPGTFKDETAGSAIMEFVGLRSKMYSIKYRMETDVDISKIDQEIEKLKTENHSVTLATSHLLSDKLVHLKMNIEKLTAKGIAKGTIKSDLRHLHYKTCLFHNVNRMCAMNLIRSYRHRLYLIHVNKLGLCGLDDKRYILNDGLDTLAFGHYSIGK